MKIVLFCHTILSDWNHGNAHFLRGIAAELSARGHVVRIYEPADSWSLQNLRRDHGDAPIDEVLRVYPHFDVVRYERATLDLPLVMDDADLVLVHEWNDPELVNAIGEHHARGASSRVLFHDTHHRSVTAPEEMRRYDLSGYDGVLAFGEAIRERYLQAGWHGTVWTWHEAADPRIFRPLPNISRESDLVWIGNWGDDERTEELQEFLLEPVARLHLDARVYGVRYPEAGREALARAGIAYEGWLANYRVPEVFARHRVTLHVPRRPYAQALPGIPTIRVFEALACGIPLVSAPWADSEGLFRPGTDYLLAASGEEMRRYIRAILHDPALARDLAENGRKTILERHTTAHRVDELLSIAASLGVPRSLAKERVKPSGSPALLEQP